MKKLTKQDYARRDEIVDKLRQMEADLSGAHQDIVDAIGRYNEKLLPDYNEAVNEAQGWIDDIASTIEQYISEKSEKWQDGDTGQAYSDWLQEWQGLQLDTLEAVDMPDEPKFEAAGVLEDGLVEEPSS